MQKGITVTPLITVKCGVFQLQNLETRHVISHNNKRLLVDTGQFLTVHSMENGHQVFQFTVTVIVSEENKTSLLGGPV